MKNPHSFGQLLSTSTLLVFALSFAAFNIQAAEKGAAFGTNFQEQPAVKSTVAADIQIVPLPVKLDSARVLGFEVKAASLPNGGIQPPRLMAGEGDGNEMGMPPHMPDSTSTPPQGDGDLPPHGSMPKPFPGLGEDHGDRNGTSTSTNPFGGGHDGNNKQTPTIDTTCLITALDTRDAAITTALNTYTSTITTALGARTTALNAAWAITDKTQRRTALRQAWTDFRTAAMKARNDLRKAKLDAWKQFMTDKKVCAPKGVPDDMTNASVDANL